ncbi:uncharacterized protein LOC106094207 isoform X2 [Stomoxys calcitrans]|nr:uncharacterized protein LOC106094207 isoform X2 [Stomoxys calcitrans]
MQLHDPRYRSLQNERCSSESIAMQSLHGTGGSPYHVYPSNNMPAVRAFQTPNASLHHMSTSPLLTTSRTHLITEMSPLPIHKSQLPQAPRTVNMSRRSTIQETSFSNQINTDDIVHKIQNMFPTASENHIRLLLKKYYNREAVVISALQVEKHPVTMPGPYVTPPGQRHLFHSNSTIHMTPPSRRFDAGSHLRGLELGAFGSNYSRTASPVPTARNGSAMSVNNGQIGPLMLPPLHPSPYFGDQFRNSPKPHSSPKMKLRYMKMIFPKADETLLLDVLANSDNNVQKASDKVISLGYAKKEFIPHQRATNQPLDAQPVNCASEEVTIIPLRPKEYSEDEKLAIKLRLQKKYPLIVEHVLLMALESVNYVEDRAMQILHIVQEEEEIRTKNATCCPDGMTGYCENTIIDPLDVHDGNDTRSDRHSHRDNADISTDKLCKEFKSLIVRVQSNGPNYKLAKGADESLLLADYVTWNGANPEYFKGQKNLAVGPNISLRCEHSYKACGPNAELRKGPQASTAKGSIYNQQHATTSKTLDIKCN